MRDARNRRKPSSLHIYDSNLDLDAYLCIISRSINTRRRSGLFVSRPLLRDPRNRRKPASLHIYDLDLDLDAYLDL